MSRTARAYVSSYVRRKSDSMKERSNRTGIYVLAVNDVSEPLTVLQATGRPNPTWIEPDSHHGLLWACYDPDRPGSDASIDCHRIDPADGTLTGARSTSIGPGSPAQIAIAPDGRHLVIANYGSGEIVVHHIDDGGGLSAATSVIRGEGSGPHPRQDGPHPHAVAFTPDGAYLVTADLGADLVQVFELDELGVLHELSRASTARGSGPRHVAFSRNARTLYVIGELDGNITVFAFDPAIGTIGKQLQLASTAPATHSGSQSAAEIALHPTGSFLYASNRASQTVAAYRVDPGDGTLTSCGFTTEGIAGPTNFAIAPDGLHLYVNSSDTDRIVPFRIDSTTSTLTPAGTPTPLRAPNVLAFAPQP